MVETLVIINNACKKLIPGKAIIYYVFKTRPMVYIRALGPSGIQFGPAKGPFKRANVEPASNNSKVKNITLKRLLWFYALARDRRFQRSSWSSFE